MKPETNNGVRFYHKDNGVKYPSITTILATIPNPELESWRQAVGEQVADYIKNQAGIRGNQLHKIIESYLKKEPIDKYKRLLPKALFENIKPEIDKISNIRCLEEILWSDELQIAGKTDCIADYDGITSIIDFKSGNKSKAEKHVNSYFLQATAYSLMWQERTCQILDNLVIILSYENGEKQVFIKKRESYIEELKHVIINYHLSNT